MANGDYSRHGRRGHSYEQRDGGWWDRGNPVSHENLLRYFGKDQLLQNERGKWDFNHAREDSLTNKQKRERFNYEMDYDKFPYDRRGNRFVRDPNAPLSKFEQLENEMKSSMGGKENLFNELDSMGKGFWQPTSDQNNPYLPKNRGSEWKALQEAIERSGEINRGPGFKRENYGFGGGEPWSSPNPFLRQEPFIYDPTIEINPNDFLRKEPFKYDPNSRVNPKDYLKPYRSGELNQLSPSGIDNYNSGSWNSGMKDWR